MPANVMDDSIKKKLYPMVETAIKKNATKVKQCVGRFMNSRNDDLFDIAPCSRIYFGANDLEDFYKSIGLNEKDILANMQDAYFFQISNFNPRAAKDPFTVAVLSIIRYFYINNKSKEVELYSTYLAFSGKFYPSIHSGSFPVVQPSEYRYIMEYVVNNELSNRFDIKKEKSVFGAVKSICNTWISSYGDKLKRFEDEDIAYIIQQLHNRIKSFMKNIADAYYRIYERKDIYFNYNSDNLDEDNYRIADNDAVRMERYTERTMNYLNARNVDYKLCKMCADTNIKADEIKSIIETILNDRDDIILVKELVRLTISIYLVNNRNKDITDINFITTSITPKPNSKNKDVIRQREIIEGWLDEKSPAYRKRKSRPATKNSYFKAILTYFVLCIFEANK